MNSKNKMVYIFLILIVLASGVLFYLNNIYFESVRNSNLKSVLVATKDIPVGGDFIEGVNFEIKMIHEKGVLPSYVLGVSSLKEKKASVAIFKGNPITKNTVGSEELTTQKFELMIASGIPANTGKGDVIRIYAQIYNKKTKETFIFRVLDSKTISDVRYVRDDKGNIKGIGGLLLLVSDEEALNYHNAKTITDSEGSSSNLIILKYNDMSELDYLSVTQFEIDSPEVRKIINDNANYESGFGFGFDFNSNYENNNSNSDNSVNQPSIPSTEEQGDNGIDNAVVEFFYTLKDGETLESILENFATSRASLEEHNPDVDFNNLVAGLSIKIVVSFQN